MKQHWRSQSQSSNNSWQMANFIGRLPVGESLVAIGADGTRGAPVRRRSGDCKRPGGRGRTARGPAVAHGACGSRAVEDVGCNAVGGYVPQTKEQGQADPGKCVE